MTSGPAASPFLEIAPRIAGAIADGRPVVALESTLITHGLAAPMNLDAAHRAEAAVRSGGAEPATIAVLEGRVRVGLSEQELEALAAHGSPRKASRATLAEAVNEGGWAGTTVSATMIAAHLAGIRVFATGGIGGVHRGAAGSFDVSSDIDELAATPVAVVSSGAKSILDLPATLEMLETRRVPVIGYGVDELPAFYSTSSGLRVPHRVDGPREAADAVRAHLAVPGSGGLLIVQPPPADLALDASEVGEWIEDALRAATDNGIRGGAVTPHLLGFLAHASGGRTLGVNIGLIVNNARTAGMVASALTHGP